jgi:DNA-binding PadR family transcriptional regulator
MLRDASIRFVSMGQASRQVVEFSSKEVVLGLVIERPDNGYQLEQRLGRLLRGAQYGRGTAEKAAKTLAEEGLIRPVEGSDVRTGKGPFEATAEGVVHFRSWLLASTSLPAVREELHAKIALCEPGDLPVIIGLVRECELACLAELQAANRRAQSKQTVVGEGAWRRRMAVIVTSSDAAWWDSRIKWLEGVHLYLEKEWLHHQAKQTAARSG